MGRGVASGQNGRIVLAAFAHRNYIAQFDLGGGDIALAAVDLDVAVAHHLPGLGAAGAEAHAVNDAVQAALKRGHQVLAGDALGVSGLFEGVAELPFQNAVYTADLLLLAKLQTVTYDLLCPFLAVLSWNEIAFLNGALFAVAALALEIKLHALTPALPADRANISCQVTLLNLSNFRCGLRPMAGLRPAYCNGRACPAPTTRHRIYPAPTLCASCEDGTRCGG